MKDIQNQRDNRSLPINRVGIKGLSYPIAVRDRRTNVQRTVASMSMSVDLPRHFKGTHMSRFLEVIHEHQDIIDIRQFGRILHSLRSRLEADNAHIDIEFPYFVEKMAPVSGSKSLMDYRCRYSGSINGKGEVDYVMGVEVPVTSLCPCSKEISQYGAHNQRSSVTIEARFAPNKFLWIEDLINIAEGAASCPVYSLLKRPDEKYITEKAYENPRFVEDVVREAAAKLLDKPEVVWFKIESENMESIHNHNAYALIEIDKRGNV